MVQMSTAIQIMGLRSDTRNESYVLQANIFTKIPIRLSKIFIFDNP
jgi:hypothetical protein